MKNKYIIFSCKAIRSDKSNIIRIIKMQSHFQVEDLAIALIATSDRNPNKVDTTLPRTPSFVASYLFEQIGKGPRLYSHPDDLKNMNNMRMMTREDYVNAISYTTDKYHVGGTNDLLDE